MSLFKTNQVKCDIGSYIHYWRGIKKVGKTTLFYDLVKEQYGSVDKGLLIAIGDEIGYNALDGLVYAESPTWQDLIEIVNELVENKSENEFEIVAFDTVDEMVTLAKKEVVRLHKKKTGQTAEFSGTFGGYGRPREKVAELIDDVLARIRKAGYGIVLIGHTKLRDIKEKNGDEYQQLTSNLNSDYDGIFANKADIVMTISVEKDIDNEKRIQGTTRYMWFRSDGFVDAGGRFSEMPERVEYGARNYINAFEEGVRKSIIGGASEAEIKKRKKAEVAKREKDAAEFAKESAASKVDTDRNDELISAIKDAFTNGDDTMKSTIRQAMEENNVENFKDNSLPTAAFEAIAKAAGVKL